MKDQFARAFQKHLIERVNDAFMMRKEDLPLSEYPAHFAEMGKLVAQIESRENLSDLIKDVEQGELEVVGIFSSDFDCFEVLVRDVLIEMGHEFRQ